MERDNWRWVVGRGVLAIVFGLVALFMPGLTWMALLAVFAAYAFVDGIASVAMAVTRRQPAQVRWWMLLLWGLAGIAIGAMIVFWPIRTSLAYLYLLGAWGIVTGVVEIVAAIRLRRELEGEWLLALAGVLSIAFGVVLFTRPVAGALALVWWLGTWAIVFGVLLIALGIRLRGRSAEPAVREPPQMPPPRRRARQAA
jgi:uncharacterized membrane protein HdeD (DUF308 family)